KPHPKLCWWAAFLAHSRASDCSQGARLLHLACCLVVHSRVWVRCHLWCYLIPGRPAWQNSYMGRSRGPQSACFRTIPIDLLSLTWLGCTPDGHTREQSC